LVNIKLLVVSIRRMTGKGLSCRHLAPIGC